MVHKTLQVTPPPDTAGRFLRHPPAVPGAPTGFGR
nr:MAG TPA: hypothetical protein [Microviridae sp.]